MRNRRAGWLLLLTATGLQAQDYAWQWPISLPRAGEPAYEVLLDESVYAAVADPLLRDIAVLDSAGRPQPLAMQAPRELRVDPDPQIESVPWFLLPGDAAPGVGMASASGRFESAGVAISWRVPDAVSATPPELLLDLGGDPRSVRAIVVAAQNEAPVWRARIEVLSSSDLQRWTPAAAPTTLYQLAQDGHRLSMLRIELDRTPSRYLRLRHTKDSARGAISAIQIERREQPLPEREPLRWLRLEASRAVEGGWDYLLPGPMRIESWSLRAGEGNWVLRARLFSRHAPEGPWQARDDAERYQWLIDEDRVSSPPGRLPGLRDRHWRLELAEERTAPPALLLGYRPDRMLFLPESDPPYRLAAGSGGARRTDAPTRAVLAAIRQHRGKDWRPLEVKLGERSQLAGEAALVPPRPPINWQAGLLWAVLIGVAGSVIIIALKLLKQPEGGQGG